MPFGDWLFGETCFGEICLGGSGAPECPPELMGHYKVRLRDTSGALVAEFDDWRFLSFSHKVNWPGACTFRMDGRDPRISLFEPNCQIEVWREIRGVVDWYIEWEGLHETGLTQVFQSGDRVFTSYSSGYLAFVQRREVLWYSGTPEAVKIAIPSQTAMYEYVNENVGPGATVAAGRIQIDGVTDGLTVPPLTGAGPNWSGNRSYRNVLEVLQEIANFSEIDFDVVGVGPAAWEFQTYVDQLGVDRTTVGLNPATGLNAAGNPPVIFSLEAGNIASVSLAEGHRGSANVIATLGQELGVYRNVQVRTNEPARTISPDRLNQREMCRNAVTQDTIAELQVLADEWLERMKPEENFTFVPLRAPSTLYGKPPAHHWWGDKTTIRFEDTDYHKRLVGVKIAVTERGEEFRSWDFRDIT